MTETRTTTPGRPDPDAVAVQRAALAARRDARAAGRDVAAEARDVRATARDREARETTGDIDAGFAARFLSAGDRDDAAGDRADALADRRASERDRRAADDELVNPTADVLGGQGFQDALEDRTVIGRAQGLLMERMHIDPDQAFEVLRQQSDSSNRSLRDVADDLLT